MPVMFLGKLTCVKSKNDVILHVTKAIILVKAKISCENVKCFYMLEEACLGYAGH